MATITLKRRYVRTYFDNGILAFPNLADRSSLLQIVHIDRLVVHYFLPFYRLHRYRESSLITYNKDLKQRCVQPAAGVLWKVILVRYPWHLRASVTNKPRSSWMKNTKGLYYFSFIQILLKRFSRLFSKVFSSIHQFVSLSDSRNFRVDAGMGLHAGQSKILEKLNPWSTFSCIMLVCESLL